MKLQVIAEIKGLCFALQHQVFSQDKHPPGSPHQQTYEEPVLFNASSPGPGASCRMFTL